MTVLRETIGVRRQRLLHVGGLLCTIAAMRRIFAASVSAVGGLSVRLCRRRGRRGSSRRGAGSALGRGLLLPESLQLRRGRKVQRGSHKSGVCCPDNEHQCIARVSCVILGSLKPKSYLPPARFGEFLLGLCDHPSKLTQTCVRAAAAPEDGCPSWHFQAQIQAQYSGHCIT